MSRTKTSPDVPQLIALDWGTSSCRAWLLGHGGTVLAAERSSEGTLTVSGRVDPRNAEARAQAFEKAFLAMCGSWLADVPDVPVIACGMVGSNQGWREAEYLTLPADLTRIAAHLVEVPFEGGTLHVVPGLRTAGDPDRGIDPDVMRGEETQVVGALDALDTGDEAGGTDPAGAESTLVLPGTHTKWVRVHGTVVSHFTTAMSGELYGLVMKNSIVGRLASPAPHGVDRHSAADAAFDRGLAAMSGHTGAHGLAAALFTARTLVMAGRLSPEDVGDYVSGLLVGDEVSHLIAVLGATTRPVTLCGTAALCGRYARALDHHGVASRTITESVSARGLWAVAGAAGLVADDRPTPTTSHEELS